MNRKQRINKLLEKSLKDNNFTITDMSHLHIGHNNITGNDETHIKISIQVNLSPEINRVEIHRKINALLKEEFQKGLHSLEIKIN